MVLALALAVAVAAEPPADDAHATVPEPEAPPSFGFALDLTVGAGVASVNHALYEQVRANTLMPRVGVGTRFTFAHNFMLGLQADAAYNPAVAYDVAWGVVTEWADPYASGNAAVVAGYHYKSDSLWGVIAEMSAGPSVAYSGGSDVALGGHGALFVGATFRFGLLELAVGPSLRAGWTKGPNAEALVLVRPSFAIGA